MIDVVYLWYVLGALALILGAVKFKRLRHRRVGVHIGSKGIGYMEPASNDKPATVYSSRNNKPMGYVEMEEEDTMENEEGDPIKYAKVYSVTIDGNGKQIPKYLGRVTGKG